MNLQDKTLAIIGLGYVGLPLAVEFGKRRPVIGFDINPLRIEKMRAGENQIELGAQPIKALGHPGAVLVDVKSMLNLGTADGRL